jgi:hypothetical protein
VAAALRLLCGVALAWCVSVALVAPETPRLTAALALLVFAAGIWRPAVALIGLAALTPAAMLLAPPPARGAELFAWAFLAAWLVRVWRPLAPAGVPRRIALPALLYAAYAAGSWLTLTIGGAAGVDPGALATHVAHAIGSHVLVFSVPEGETVAALQIAAGIGVLLAAAAAARAEPSLPQRLAWTTAIAMAVLAVVTCVDVVRQWSAFERPWDAAFLIRYVRGERFTRHLGDLNAAGSQYVLAAGIALGLAAEGRRRGLWVAIVVVMMPAFWLTGSRSAGVALLGAIAALAAARHAGPRPSARTQLAVAATIGGILVAAASALAVAGGDHSGSAGRALRLRSQFSETSVRMVASAPVFGVGVGRYFPRSPEFMPAELRELYGAENAHNYFAQQFAELGLAGGALFVWLMAAAVAAGWRHARTTPRDPAAVAFFSGCAGYLLTCVTGHPFLVSEAAFPFWIALGAMAGTTETTGGRPRRVAVALAAIALALLAANVGRGVAAYADATERPPESGFDGEAVADDGRRFRWTSPHAVTYLPAGPGFLRMTLRAPDREFARPVMVETAIAGRLADRRELPRGEWVTVEIPVRAPAAAAFRRVDVRVMPFWTDKRPLGRRSAPVDIPLGVMAAEVRWVGLAGR